MRSHSQGSAAQRTSQELASSFRRGQALGSMGEQRTEFELSRRWQPCAACTEPRVIVQIDDRPRWWLLGRWQALSAAVCLVRSAYWSECVVVCCSLVCQSNDVRLCSSYVRPLESQVEAETQVIHSRPRPIISTLHFFDPNPGEGGQGVLKLSESRGVGGEGPGFGRSRLSRARGWHAC